LHHQLPLNRVAHSTKETDMNIFSSRHATSVLAIALAFGACMPLAAQSAANTQTSLVQLRIATGKPGKGFSKVFADIRSVCGATVPLVEIETEGGLQNLTALAANKADLGFVQVDTFATMQDSDASIATLQTVMPMNVNLLHVVARNGGYELPRTGRLEKLLEKVTSSKVVMVSSFGELRGLPVAVVGSARALARELNRAQSLGMQFVDVSNDEEGLARLKRGDVAALLSTSGWPSGPMQALRRSDGLHLVPYDARVQEPYLISTRNYENIDGFKLPFLGVPNALMARPFTPGGAYGRAVATLRDCVRRNLLTLREGPYEPMWQEVRLDAPAAAGTKGTGASAR
jgi:TRAP-type uncharacterized transport system substrate-binding protein